MCSFIYFVYVVVGRRDRLAIFVNITNIFAYLCSCSSQLFFKINELIISPLFSRFSSNNFVLGSLEKGNEMFYLIRNVHQKTFFSGLNFISSYTQSMYDKVPSFTCIPTFLLSTLLAFLVKTDKLISMIFFMYFLFLLHLIFYFFVFFVYFVSSRNMSSS